MSEIATKKAYFFNIYTLWRDVSNQEVLLAKALHVGKTFKEDSWWKSNDVEGALDVEVNFQAV